MTQKNFLEEENFKLFKKLVEMTYGSQKEIKNRSEGPDKNKLTSVLIYKPLEEINDSIIEYYSSELRSLSITNYTWDERLWAFKAHIPGSLINKLKEKGFIVFLDRKIKIISEI